MGGGWCGCDFLYDRKTSEAITADRIEELKNKLVIGQRLKVVTPRTASDDARTEKAFTGVIVAKSRHFVELDNGMWRQTFMYKELLQEKTTVLYLKGGEQK